MAKAKETKATQGGIVIRTADTSSARKRVIGLAESVFQDRKTGRNVVALAVTLDDVPVRGLSFLSPKWQLLRSIFAEAGPQIEAWAKAHENDGASE